MSNKIRRKKLEDIKTISRETHISPDSMKRLKAMAIHKGISKAEILRRASLDESLEVSSSGNLVGFLIKWSESDHQKMMKLAEEAGMAPPEFRREKLYKALDRFERVNILRPGPVEKDA